jgi:hypothetical protein
VSDTKLEEANIIYFPNLCLKLNSLLSGNKNMGKSLVNYAFLNFLINFLIGRDYLIMKIDLTRNKKMH